MNVYPIEMRLEGATTWAASQPETVVAAALDLPVASPPVKASPHAEAARAKSPEKPSAPVILRSLDEVI
jgi:hypothetical protein